MMAVSAVTDPRVEAWLIVIDIVIPCCVRRFSVQMILLVMISICIVGDSEALSDRGERTSVGRADALRRGPTSAPCSSKDLAEAELL